MKIFTLIALFAITLSFPGYSAVSPSEAFGTNNIIIRQFSATTDGRVGNINWTFDEIQFEVTCWLQRSADGINFTTIQAYEVNPGINVKMKFEDRTAQSGINYYRLHIVKSGFVPLTSHIISIKITANENSEEDYRVVNPFTNQIAIAGDFTNSKKLQVELIDLGGRVVVKHVNTISGSSIVIPANNISRGMYLVRVKDLNNREEPMVTRWIYKNAD